MNPLKIVSELRVTHWILERWAISVGDGLYGIRWEDIPQSAVPPRVFLERFDGRRKQ